MKTFLKGLNVAFLVIGAICIVGCSDSKSEPPVPPDQPVTPQVEDEIPIIAEAPSQYIDSGSLRVDTMLNRMAGGPINILIPVFKIIKHTAAGEEITTEFDDQIFIEHQGVNYQYGDILPFSFRGTISHTKYLGVPGPELEIDGISMGTFTTQTDEQVVLHWPQKDLKVYVRLFRQSEKVELPPNWYDVEDSDELGGFRVVSGMYVNGIGATCFAIHIFEDGKVALARLNECYNVNTGYFNK